MDFVNLVKLIGSREQRCQSEYFIEHATDTPVVHLVIVVSVGEQAFRRSVPSGANVLCERRFGVDASARSEVSQFDDVASDKDILGLDVSVIDTVSVHMVNRLEDLVHHSFYAWLRQRYTLAFDCFVHVHLHEFKHESQTAGWLVIEYL